VQIESGRKIQLSWLSKLTLILSGTIILERSTTSICNFLRDEEKQNSSKNLEGRFGIELSMTLLMHSSKEIGIELKPLLLSVSVTPLHKPNKMKEQIQKSLKDMMLYFEK
jgi:hypothetical protein